MLPNFLIVGASKCGTTALYYYLKQHPNISFPELKEPKYFSSQFANFPHNGVGDLSVDKYALKSFSEYKKIFDRIENKKVGEASPDTIFYHKETAPLIKQKLGDIPIIIILREPVKRAFSAYMYLKRDSREFLSFREGLNAEEERRKNNWDFIWSYKQGGLYFNQVKTFFDNFTNVKVILQEDLKNNTGKILQEIFSFLNVTNNIEINTSIKHNESGIPKNIFAKFLLSRNNMFSVIFREIMKIVIPRVLLEKVASKSLVKEVLSLEDQEYLKPYFDEDIGKLEKLIDRDLSIWK